MDEKLKTLTILQQKFIILRKVALCNEINVAKLREHTIKRKFKTSNALKWRKFTNIYTLISLMVVISVVLLNYYVMTNAKFIEQRCSLFNNFFIMELSRPVTNCNICRDVTEVKIFHNVTKEKFLKYAYSSRPMLVTGATMNWSAINTFDFKFFQKIYEETDGAYDIVEEDCQFFPFRTRFFGLKQALSMSSSRASMSSPNEESWYIGWSNCDPTIGKILRQHYQKPHFLPDGSEHSVLDWIFMGWAGQGTNMHLDYVQRPSWQAQISGTKTWKILPPPECELVCSPMNITVHSGDIILLDTNQWYHETYIHPGTISITIGSEYD